MLRYIIAILLLLPLNILAKDYQVKLHVAHLPADSRPLLLRIYNGNLFILDSIPVRNREEITFKIPDHTPSGQLRAILGMPSFAQFRTNNQPISLDLIFNQEDIEIRLDYKSPDHSVEIVHSEENRIYFNFLKADALYFQKLGLLEQVVLNYPDQDEFYQKALDYYHKFQQQRDKFIDKTYNGNSKLLAGKIIKNQKLPFTNGKLTSTERDSIFRSDFLAKVDFNDTTLLYTNVYTDKIFQYIQMYMKREAGLRENEANCIRALDQIVPTLDVNPIIQQHLLQFLISGFESMKMEEVLAHISSNYLQQCGSSADIIKRRLEGYSKMAIGQKVPDFTVTDIMGNIINLYSQINPYTLILFWHTGCNHCQMLMQELSTLNQKNFFSQNPIRVIGISIDDHKEEWEKISATFPLNWTNTFIEGSFESPVASDYNLFATPSMFLVDDNFKIIAKPTTVEELKQDVEHLK